jgi:hypothetical protein
MSGCRSHLIKPIINTPNNRNSRSYVYQCGHLVPVLLCSVGAEAIHVVVLFLGKTEFRPQILNP